MRRIDEPHLNYPVAGGRMMAALPANQGVDVGRRHVRTLMKKMGIEAIYRKPDTSEAGSRARDPSVSSSKAES
jgi:putative transposase